MAVSGLVITIEQGKDAETKVIEALGKDQRFTIGPRQEGVDGGRLPVILETDTRVENRAAWEWLNALDGVVHVDVAYVQLDEAGPRDPKKGSANETDLNGDTEC